MDTHDKTWRHVSYTCYGPPQQASTMCPENYWSIRHSVLPFSADPRPRRYSGPFFVKSGAVLAARQINRWNNQPGSRHAILDQRFDRSENSDLSFAELHAAASQQPCTASQPLQGCRQCEPWTAATPPIDPATAWPADRVRLRPGYL